MKKILFVCHGNICRSPMAEAIFRDMLDKQGLSDRFLVNSAAVSDEELGRPVYPAAQTELRRRGLPESAHRAWQLRREDYDRYDYLVGMDSANLRNMRRICGGDPQEKLHLLMDFTDRPGDVADPWYTGDFDATWRDVDAGCRALLAALTGPNPEKSDIL